MDFIRGGSTIFVLIASTARMWIIIYLQKCFCKLGARCHIGTLHVAYYTVGNIQDKKSKS